MSTIVSLRPHLTVRVAWREGLQEEASSVWRGVVQPSVKWMPHQLTFVDRHGNVQYVTVAATQLITLTPEKPQ